MKSAAIYRKPAAMPNPDGGFSPVPGWRTTQKHLLPQSYRLKAWAGSGYYPVLIKALGQQFSPTRFGF
jgi:hypothetical protein